MNDHEERIRARAHQIWQREGGPDGRDAEHWHTAEREIREEGSTAAEPGGVHVSTAHDPTKPAAPQADAVRPTQKGDAAAPVPAKPAVGGSARPAEARRT